MGASDEDGRISVLLAREPPNQVTSVTKQIEKRRYQAETGRNPHVAQFPGRTMTKPEVTLKFGPSTA